MKKVIPVVILVISVLSFTGCATILSGKTTKVNVTTSNNKPATLTIKNRTYQAPGIIDLDKVKEDLFIKASGECEGQAFSTKKIETTFWVNILSGGSFGSTTDYSTDAMWKYDDNIEIKCK